MSPAIEVTLFRPVKLVRTLLYPKWKFPPIELILLKTTRVDDKIGVEVVMKSNYKDI